MLFYLVYRAPPVWAYRPALKVNWFPKSVPTCLILKCFILNQRCLKCRRLWSLKQLQEKNFIAEAAGYLPDWFWVTRLIMPVFSSNIIHNLVACNWWRWVNQDCARIPKLALKFLLKTYEWSVEVVNTITFSLKMRAGNTTWLWLRCHKSAYKDNGPKTIGVGRGISFVVMLVGGVEAMHTLLLCFDFES